MPLSLTQTVAPTSEPVSLVEVKQHLRVTHNSEDALLLLYMQAAREHIERTTRRQLLTATYVLGLDAFPSCDTFRLPRAPIQSVTSIAYLDTAGVSQTLATSVYGVNTRCEPGQVFLKYGQTWPSSYSQEQAVTVTYLAGWGHYSQVPPQLKMALLLLVGHCYEHREATAEKALMEVPFGVGNLLWLHRVEVV